MALLEDRADPDIRAGGKVGIRRDGGPGEPLRLREERLVGPQIGEAEEGRPSMLTGPEEISLPADLEIRARDRKPVVRAAEHTEPFGGLGAGIGD